MVLSRDVVNVSGTVLLAKDTMLNNINYTKLIANDLGHVYIKPESVNLSIPIFTFSDIEAASVENQKIPVEERPEFPLFKAEYDYSSDETKRCLYEISEGGQIDLNHMYAITNNIMGKLRCKSDVFYFLSNIKDSDEPTFHHSVNVSLLCNIFGRWMGYDSEDLANLTTSGLLHDIGKTKTPSEILNKQGKFTEQEYEIMKKHTILGYRIMQQQDIPSEIKLGALMHHEKIDGSGYPLGITGGKIGNIAKILTICDIYDAMTANRVYRKKLCPFEVIKMFESRVYGELDTKYLLTFLQSIAYSYLGRWVLLSNAIEAEVVFINSRSLSQPVVRTTDDEFIDLSMERTLSISDLTG